MGLSRSEQLYDRRWLATSERIKIRDNNKCLICGSSDHFLEVHHLYYLPGFLAWDYDDEAMVTVCRLHHEQLTYDLPKVSGLIAFRALKMNIDLTNLLELLKNLKP